MKEWEKIFHTNVSQKGVRMIIFIAEKKQTKSKIVTRDQKGYYAIIKDPIL